MRARVCLTFHGQADAALAHYQSAFPAMTTGKVVRHGEGPMAGKILSAEAALAGLGLIFADSLEAESAAAAPGQTGAPGLSLLVDTLGPQDLDDAYAILALGGIVRTPPGPHGSSRRFAAVEDKFGVLWQLNLP